jgi:hypothetical protein
MWLVGSGDLNTYYKHHFLLEFKHQYLIQNDCLHGIHYVVLLSLDAKLILLDMFFWILSLVIDLVLCKAVSQFFANAAYPNSLNGLRIYWFWLEKEHKSYFIELFLSFKIEKDGSYWLSFPQLKLLLRRQHPL